MYFIVDAIGAYGADEIDFEKYGIDVLIISSQKALALSPGVSIAVVSEKIYWDRVIVGFSGSYYLDFKLHIDDMKRGQTPFTPAVGILLALNQRLKQIQMIGIKQIIQNTQKLAFRFRYEIDNSGFEVPKYPLSNALTPVIAKPDAENIPEPEKQIWADSNTQWRRFTQSSHKNWTSWQCKVEIL